MFRSVVISHDGSRCIEGTLRWLKPLLGSGHSHVELYARQDAPTSGELNSSDHLQELAAVLSAGGADVEVLPPDYDLFESTHQRLVVVHDPALTLRLLRETSASLLFTPEGITPHVPTRILVPLDGSSYCEEILPLLVPFAIAYEPTIELLRVAPDDVRGQGSLMVHQSVPTRVSLLKSLERGKAFLEEKGLEVTVHTSESGAVHRRILETAAKDQADLIAVSTHGHNRIARWLFGSCTETLVKSGTTPILIRNTSK